MRTQTTTNLQAQSPNIPLLRPFFNIKKIIANQKHQKKFPIFVGGQIFSPRTNYDVLLLLLLFLLLP